MSFAEKCHKEDIRDSGNLPPPRPFFPPSRTPSAVGGIIQKFKKVKRRKFFWHNPARSGRKRG